ncbi:hypothetical protein QQ045_011429 [Rhodiola kirilowii]
MNRKSTPMTRQEERIIRLQLEYFDTLKQIKQAKKESKTLDESLKKKWEEIVPLISTPSPENPDEKYIDLLKLREMMMEMKQKMNVERERRNVESAGGSASTSKSKE